MELRNYIDVNNPIALFDEKSKQEKQEEQTLSKTEISHAVDPDGDTISKIKEILSLKKPQQVVAPVFVPEQVNMIMDQLKDYLQATDVSVDEVLDISYGKKIRTSVGMRKAETNFFYGKKGYSVVVSPKSGTNGELNDMVAELIKIFLNLA